MLNIFFQNTQKYFQIVKNFYCFSVSFGFSLLSKTTIDKQIETIADRELDKNKDDCQQIKLNATKITKNNYNKINTLALTFIYKEVIEQIVGRNVR